MQNLGSNFLATYFLREKSVQNKHKRNEAETKSPEPKLLKNSSIKSIISKLIVWFHFLVYHIQNQSLKDMG